MFAGKQEMKQRGITVLETAIILIAFVVVASVFAFTVLSTGTILDKNDKFSITLSPPDGAVMVLEKSLPPRLDAVMDLK
ncbi:MAG: archaellin/type IV pilin N-terminal domain-containing protein [Dehalococcoidia bacterium]